MGAQGYHRLSSAGRGAPVSLTEDAAEASLISACLGQNPSMNNPIPKNTICLWYNKDALDAARFYAATFPDSQVTAVHHAPSDYPSGKAGDVLTVEFTVLGIPCLGLNGGPDFPHSEAFSFQVATDTQEETDRYWNAIVGNGGQESACGWCKDRWDCPGRSHPALSPARWPWVVPRPSAPLKR
jgi:predicted 3-demethylubiquinone-9 3-methyltransferase (glyoxalase superfamily)